MTARSVLPVCDVDDLAPGQMRRLEREDGPALAVFNVDGELYATDDLCTHGQSSLTDEGTLEGYVIECGWHRGSFDVRTGTALTAPCQQPLRSYPVELREGRILVVVEPDTSIVR